MSKVFISYRRVDSQDLTRSIYQEIQHVYGEKNVFLDVEIIEAADDWWRVIKEQIHECDVFLIIIGEKWTTIENDAGLRLFQQEDPVRREIEEALDLGKKIMPVLLNNAEMPRHENLPESLHPVLRKQYLRVRSGRDYRNDCKELIKRLKKIAPPSRSPIFYSMALIFILIILAIGAFLLTQVTRGIPEEAPAVITQPFGSNPADSIQNPVTVAPTEDGSISFLCEVEEFSWSPVLSTYEAGTVLSLYGRGDCRGSVRASRFNIDGDSYGEDASAFTQAETWTMTPGTHTICFEITVGEWEAGASQCAEFVVE